MRCVLVDPYDSFVHVIKQYLLGLGLEVTVVRSAADNAARIRLIRADFLLLGPGPGHPLSSGHIELIREFEGQMPILGVCLGHQAIASAYGATVLPAANAVHGKTSIVDHDGRGMFARASPGLTAVRYHSLVVAEKTLPADLVVTAYARDDGHIMGLRHRRLPIESVQFHPEGVLTQEGINLLSSFIWSYLTSRS